MTNSRDKFVRVTPRGPCPICKKPDWCLMARDGGAVICARIESSTPIGKREHAGWLHVLRHNSVGKSETSRKIRLCRVNPIHRKHLALVSKSEGGFEALAGTYTQALSRARLAMLSKSLGLTTESLARLNIGWSEKHGAYSFPMWDAAGSIIGIRLRSTNGTKFAVRGSRQGLFVPPLVGLDCLLVAEGPTDCAALLDWGFDAVGRPSCNGGIGLLRHLVQMRRPAQVVIVADGDTPGQLGAERLASVLTVYAPIVRVLTPPVKDAREWLRLGATAADVLNVINSSPVCKLQMAVGQHGARA